MPPAGARIYFQASVVVSLVEWALDQGAGYVLTGLMVRKSQDMEEDRKENLDIIGIVSEYQSPCIQDIHHLPVVEKGKKEMILKNFNSCSTPLCN